VFTGLIVLLGCFAEEISTILCVLGAQGGLIDFVGFFECGSSQILIDFAFAQTWDFAEYFGDIRIHHLIGSGAFGTYPVSFFILVSFDRIFGTRVFVVLPGFKKSAATVAQDQ
jgi:hypothetical protein